MADTKKYVSLDKLSLYNEKIKAKISADDATTLQSAKDYAKSYADSLATNYDAAGSAAAVQAKLDAEVTRAKAAEEANATAAKQAQDEVDALELVVADKADKTALDSLSAKVGDVPADQTVMGIINNIQESAYDDTEVRSLITGLTNDKADKTQVAADIAAAVKVEEDARKEAVAGVQSSVDTLSQTHATDKAALEDAIALKADQTALDDAIAAAATKDALTEEVNRAKGEEARIEGLVTAEAAKAREEEGKLDARLVEVETFFKTAEGETIDQAMDTLVEIQKYITEDGAAADEMVKDIAANAKAIADHVALDHDFAAADATLKADLEGQIELKADKTTVEGIDGRLTTVEGKVTTLEGKVSTLEGEMDDVQAAVATKVEQEAYNTKVQELVDADAGQVERIAALEAKFGGADGSVEDMIADAKAEAINTASADATIKANAAETNAKSYTDGEIDKVEATISTLQGVVDTKAAQADLTALTNRVTTAEGEIDTLQSEMNAVEALAAANKAAHEANAKAIELKADITALTAVSDRVGVLEAWHNNFTEVSEAEINALFA